MLPGHFAGCRHLGIRVWGCLGRGYLCQQQLQGVNLPIIATFPKVLSFPPPIPTVRAFSRGGSRDADLCSSRRLAS